MKVLGVIVEYNPFHNGHLYHLTLAKELVKPDYVVAIMSGSFCQRGEPAIISKFSRAEMALLNGIDLVFELPFVYAIQDAGGFAKGAVWSLHHTGVVTDIVFGSESADLAFLQKIARIMAEQPEPFPAMMKEELKKGHSFPNARKYALMRYFEVTGEMNPKEVLKIEKSNDILGVEYLKSLIELNSPIRPHVVKRVGAEDKDERFRGKFSSATAIRKCILKGDWEKVAKAVPTSSLQIISRELNEGRGPVSLQDLELLILSKLRLVDRFQLQRLHGFNEGIDKRFVECATKVSNLEEFFSCVKSKRFTLSKIRRLSLYSFFELDSQLIEKSNTLGPQYLRVLGFNSKGRELLSKMKRVSTVPIISLCSLYKKVLEQSLKKPERFKIDAKLFERQLMYDIKSTSIHSLMFPRHSERIGDMDFKFPPIAIS
ncbi:nucleotidyltransferase [Pseudothermotoga sp.]|nr:nucleotidyltransferase [Pseudothermotoga sp.]MCX7812155.1 nucleotidyltransferase [Pseudothermotoga sp.]MDW8139225.1 nucleotidyltransferase [Pseudothermotoga sp.]